MNDRLLAALCLIVTVVIYALSRWIHRRRPVQYLSPIVITPVVLLALVLTTRIPFRLYIMDTRWLMWLLGPATIAFAVPIYQQRALVRRYPLSLIAGVVSGVIFGVVSSWALAKLFALPPEIGRSLLPRSVSTPFAVTASETLGGSRDLTALFVLITGVLGMLIGEAFLGWLRLRSSLARGASFGAAAHAVGTAKAREIGQEEGAISSLVMIFAGVLMVLLAPLLATHIH